MYVAANQGHFVLSLFERLRELECAKNELPEQSSTEYFKMRTVCVAVCVMADSPTSTRGKNMFQCCLPVQ